MKQLALVVFAALLLASCGGGGHTSTSVPPTPGAAGATQGGALSLTFATPSQGTAPATTASTGTRKPKFVSPNATSAMVSINSGTAQTFNVGSSSSLCTTVSNVRTCTIPLTAPLGADSISVSLLGPVGGNPVLLGQGSNSVTVVAGTNFNLTVGINPMVASVNSGQLDAACCYVFGQTNSQFSTITFADATGANITGSGNVPNFLAPITLTSSDPNFTTNPTTLTTPGQGFLVNYNGSTSVAQSVTITASVGSLTLTSETFQLPGLFITRYNLGAANTIDPQQIAADAGGNVWVAENDTNAIVRISSAGVVSAPFATGIGGGAPVGVAVGTDGNIYYGDENSCDLGRMNAGGIQVGGLAAANGGGCHLWQMTADNSGNIWYIDAGNNEVGYISIAGWPSPGVECGVLPTAFSFSIHQQITVGPDGAIWFTEGGNGHKIGRYGGTASCDPAGLTEFQPPAAPNSQDLGGLVVGSDDNLWFTEFTADQFAKITAPGGAMTEYPGIISPTAFANPVWLASATSNGDLYIPQGGGAVSWNPSNPAAAFTQSFIDVNGQEGQTDMHSAIYIPAATGAGALWFSGLGSNPGGGYIATQDEVAKFVPR